MSQDDPVISVQHSEGQLDGHGGLFLYRQQWLPTSRPSRAGLVLVHGYSEHGGRYQEFGTQLARLGFSVFSWDHRGHGRSPGQRGHIDSMADYRGDLAAQILLARSICGDSPMFLFGHSMGSLIVLDYALRHPVKLRGVITSGAGLEPAGIAKPLVVTIARTFSRLWPRLPMKMQVEASDLSSIPDAIDAYNQDPLVHKKASARWGCELLDAIDWIKAHAAEFSLPLLMLHGDADRINLPSGSKAFVAAVRTDDATLKLYSGCRHEVHHDSAKQQLISDLANWLGSRI